MTCPDCGRTNIAETSNFCPNCGKPLPRPDAPTPAGAQVSVDAHANTVQDGGTIAGVLAPGADEVNVYVSAPPPTYATPPNAPQAYVPRAARHTIFGRDKELGTITSVLRQRRTILLHGMGGVGKSALAAEAARHLHAEAAIPFKGGILWVSDIGAAPVATVCDAIARQLRDESILTLPPGLKPDATRQLLAGRDLLLVLDDLALPETAQDFVDTCLPDGMALLATSRQYHEVFDEDVHLEPPDREAAIDLFLDRARLPSEGQTDLVGRICDLLENHPLALVIAAGLVKVRKMPLSSLHTQLANEKTRLPTLALGEDKDRNVWTSITLSYDDLDERERLAFAALAACFGESTGLELLAEVCGITLAECERYVGELVVRSLVEREGDRLRQHQLVTDFGRVVLGDRLQLEQDQVVEAAITYAERYRGNSPEAHDKLEAELGNLIGATEHAFARQQWNSTLLIADVLTNNVLYTRGHWTEHVAVGQLGIAAAKSVVKEDRDEWLLAMFTHNTGIVLQNQGQYIEAGTLYEQSLEISKKLGDQLSIAGSLHQLGMIAQKQGNYEEARTLYEQSLEIGKKLGDQSGIAQSLHQLGNIAYLQGNYEEARTLYEQSLEIAKKLGNQSGIAQSLHQLGVIAETQGNYEEARTLYEQSLEIKKKLRNQSGIASSLHQLGMIAQMQGNYEEARTLYEQSLEIAKKLGDQLGIAQSLHQLGMIAQKQGNYEEARTLYEQSLEIAKKLGDQLGIAHNLHQVGVIEFEQGNLEGARQLIGEALEIFERLGSPVAETARQSLATIDEQVAEERESKGKAEGSQ